MDKTILREYENAVFFAQCGGDSRQLDLFAHEHPSEYKLITAMYRKRVAMSDTLSAMGYLNEPMYWFTLTFNSVKDKCTIDSKRNSVQNFLSKIAPVYLMVEEYGEDNGRYHVHGFLIFRYGCGFNDFRLWHSRQKLQELTDNIKKKKIRYLTKYAVKSVPRLRRSKMCSILYNEYTKHKKLRYHFNCLLEEHMKKVVDTKISLF